MDSAWIAGIFGIVGSLVGGAFTYLSTYHQENSRSKKESKILSESIAAEISSILWLLEKHDYVTGLQMAVEKTAKREPMLLVWPVKREYCRVFNANVSRIGQMPRGAGEVVLFYNLIQSLMEDLEVLTEDLEKIYKSENPMDPGQIDWVRLSPRYANLRGKLITLIDHGQKARSILQDL